MNCSGATSEEPKVEIWGAPLLSIDDAGNLTGNDLNMIRGEILDGCDDHSLKEFIQNRDVHLGDNKSEKLEALLTEINTSAKAAQDTAFFPFNRKYLAGGLGPREKGKKLT